MKTYCISDIHGHYDRLKAFTETLDEDDVVYVLGDVIDKGEDPMGCLLHVMNDSRFTMLLGNHEHMMYHYLTCKSHIDKLEAYSIWVEWNLGYQTLNQYLDLDEDKKNEIRNYIRDLPLNIPDVEVNGRHYYLVHSCPNGDKQVTMADLNDDEEEIAHYIWDRATPSDCIDVKDRTVIAGHTAVLEYSNNYSVPAVPFHNGRTIKEASYIDIDGGLAYGEEGSRLIALCLDDLSYRLY